MVPTFCVEDIRLFVLLLPLGRAKAGDGDLPLPGEGGGDPKRESSSSSDCPRLISISMALSCALVCRGFRDELVRVRVNAKHLFSAR